MKGINGEWSVGYEVEGCSGNNGGWEDRKLVGR